MSHISRFLIYVLLIASFRLIFAHPRGSQDAKIDDAGTGIHVGDDDPTAVRVNVNVPRAIDDNNGTLSVPSDDSTGSDSSMDVLRGDMQCPGSQLLCVTGIVNGSFITYELQSTGAADLGWMAIGFGTQMPNTSLVIMWANRDGSITLSQRMAPQHVMPTPVANPPRIATPLPQLSILIGSQPKLAFTIPGIANYTDLVWAYGTTKPEESPDSILVQHIAAGPFALDLTQPFVNVNKTVPSPAKISTNVPFLRYQKLIIAHAVFVALGFLILLPAGVLLARHTRTYNNKWFQGHWIIQFGLAGPAIIIGCILGFVAVNAQGGGQPHTLHKTLGQVLLVLYVFQCALGAFIHFVKIRVWVFNRPPQNYFHAVLGLTILALAFFQAHLGYTREWPNTTGRPPVPKAVNILWIVLLAIVAAAYIIGLGYLPRQYRQESLQKERSKENFQVTN